MIKQVLIIGLISILTSCFAGTEKTNDIDLIKEYYEAYNSKDYKTLEKLVSEDIIVIEMNYKVLETKTAFIDLIQWGEVFNAKNEIVSIKEENGVYIIDETQDSERIQFLYGQSLKAKTTITVENGKISKIDIDLIDFDIDKMSKGRNELLFWVKVNHPDKLSNLNKLNKLGGQTFKEAMTLFENKN